ncbi:MAG: glycine-rich domain-containing protein [Candidatus Saccharimonadales bacterium]
MTVTSSVAPASVELTNKSLVSNQLWVRLTNRIAKDENLDPALAERIMDQALAFLRLCAEPSTESYSPSPLVDIGWHTFILYTREYAAFCQGLNGQFIHHAPSDEDGIDYGSGNIARTVAALKQRGIGVDEPLWANTGHDCSAYCSGDSCSGGGR